MKNKNKKFGGTIKDWQIHTLSLKQEDIDKLYPNEGLQPLVMTGTVVEDKLGTHLNKSSTPRNRSTTIT